MNFKRLLLFLIAPLALVMNSCTEEGPDYSLPTIAITDTEGNAIKEISFDAAGGTQKFVIISTRSWSINSTAEWLVFNPTKHDNASLLEMACEVEVTAGPNDGIARSEAITITMDKKTETLTILQADKDGNNATLNGATPITVAEFLQKQEGDETIYQLTGTIGGSINTQYGNFDLTDATGTVYIYGLKDADGKTIDWAATKLAGGDIITVQGKFYLYNDKVEMKDALYISHEKGEAPAPKEGPYASDAAFVCEYDNSSEAAYGLGATKLGDYDATGFKLGKKAQEGKFTSAAVGVEGNKYLNFYAVSWGAGGDKTIYYRVKGGEIKSQAIKANTGAADNAPYNNIVVAASDHYSVQLTGLKATDVIEFSTNEAFDSAELAEGSYATRAIFFGVKLSDEPIEAVEGGNTGGGSADVVKATVAEFLATTDENTVYELTGEITGTYNTEYGNFYLKDATGEVVIYGLYKDGQKCYTSLGLKDGDTITVQGKHSVYNDKVQMKNAEYISHTAGEGGGTEEPEPEQPVVEGDYTSDTAFVCSTDNSTTASYSLKTTKIGNDAVTGFKLGTGKLTGIFTSAAVGVSGDKYLNFYAVAWKGKSATLYWRVDGGATQSQTLAAHDGASGTIPFAELTARDSDHYSVQLTGLTANSVIEFSTDASFSAADNETSGRAVVFGVKLTDEPLGNAGGGTEEPEPEQPATPVKATVAEFLNAAEDATVYELTGTIKGTYNTEYGNFYLKDATGEVVIYGLYKDGQKCYTSLGLKDGDTITVQGARASYNGKAQMKNAEYISHTVGEGGGTEEPEEPEEPEQPAETIVATIAEFIAAEESTTQWYELTGKITSIEKADYGNIYIQDETTSVLIYGLCATKVEENDQSFASLGLKVGDTVTLHTLRTSYKGTAQGGGTPPAYYISHEEGVVVEPEVPEGSVLASAVFAEMGLSDKQNVDGKTIAIDENVSIVFKKGGASTAPTYYANGMAIRMYQNGSTLDVTANGKTITSIELTFASNMYYIGADSGELSAEAAMRTWTGSASAVKFTSTGTDKEHRAYVTGIKVTYTE